MCLGLKHSCEFGLSRFENSVINKAIKILDLYDINTHYLIDLF